MTFEIDARQKLWQSGFSPWTRSNSVSDGNSLRMPQPMWFPSVPSGFIQERGRIMFPIKCQFKHHIGHTLSNNVVIIPCPHTDMGKINRNLKFIIFESLKLDTKWGQMNQTNKINSRRRMYFRHYQEPMTCTVYTYIVHIHSDHYLYQLSINSDFPYMDLPFGN